MANKTLIVNMGPPGDVVRTTALHNELEGEIYWLTSNKSADLLGSQRISDIFYIEDPKHLDRLNDQRFANVLSLNDEPEMRPFLGRITNWESWEGVYYVAGKPRYTDPSAAWFDMSLISRHGKADADRLKLANRRPVQSLYFEMLGLKWGGQEYDIGVDPEAGVRGRIGLISTVTGRWPNKGWTGYSELTGLLQRDGYDVVELGMRPTIAEHIADINRCEVVVCGDTLGMHIALGLKKKVAALFNCTSPHEIYNYGRLEKVVSPLYEKYFYDKRPSEAAISAITVREVHSAVKDMLRSTDRFTKARKTRMQS